jgi:hypothetical protein
MSHSLNLIISKRMESAVHFFPKSKQIIQAQFYGEWKKFVT